MDPLKRCKQILLPCCAISFVMAAILLARLGLSTNQVSNKEVENQIRLF